jgi:hypothetical protein
VGVVVSAVVGRGLADDCEMAIAAVGIAVVVPIIVGSKVGTAIAVVGVDVDVDGSPVAAMMVGRGVADRSATGVVVVITTFGVSVLVVGASGAAGAREGSLVVRRGEGCFVSFVKKRNTTGWVRFGPLAYTVGGTKLRTFIVE